MTAPDLGDPAEEERGITTERSARQAPSTLGPIAYIMSRFPLLTETFILREMLELERQGVALEVYPLLRADPSVRHHELERLRARVHYTPFLSAAIVSANLHFLRRGPRRYLKLLWTVVKGNFGSANLFFGALGIFPKSVYLARLAEKQAVAHVHAHYATHPALCGLIISELTGLGFSFTAHAHDIFMHQRMLDEKIDRARFVVAISAHNKDYLHRIAPAVPPDKIAIVHCGIELEKYDVAHDRATPRSQPITAVCVASLQPYKGLNHLVRACAEVVRDQPRFRCLVAGEGVDRPKLQGLIDELGLHDNFILLGGLPQREVAKLLADADLFVLPSIVAPSGQMDGIPVALMEAMASQLPVVSTRLSGIPELVEDGVNGLLVAPGDDSALAAAISRLSRDPELRRQMGPRGRDKVAAEFELEGCVEALRKRFEDAAVSSSAKPRKGAAQETDPIGPDIAEWARKEISSDDGHMGAIQFKRVGGGADSQVFEVERAVGTASLRRLILKLHRPSEAPASGASERNQAEAENDFLSLTLLRNVFARHSPHLSVPKPLALNREHAAVLMEKCAGQRLDRAIRWARFRSGVRPLLPSWFGACGEWLALLHQATASQDDPSAVFADLEAGFHCDLLRCRERGLDAGIAASAARFFADGKGAAFQSRLGLVGRHCDFAPYNVLVSADGISVIDFEGLQQGIAFDDICYFLRMLEVTPAYHLNRGTISTLREQFLAGYERHRNLDREALDFFMLLTTVKVMAHTPVLRQPKTWLDALKRRRHLRFYSDWFAGKLPSAGRRAEQ